MAHDIQPEVSSRKVVPATDPIASYVTNGSSTTARELRQRAENRLRAYDTSGKQSTTGQTLSSDETLRDLHELQVHQIELEMQNEELRHTQYELEVLQNRFFDLYDLAPVGYLTFSEHGLISEANLAAATMLGISRSRLMTQPVARFIHQEEREAFQRLRTECIETSAPLTCEIRLIQFEGSPFWANLQLTRAQNSEYWLTFSDISVSKLAEEEQRRLEHQLQQAQKLESLGVLAGGIAHDFNNILTVILCNCALLQQRPQMLTELVPEIDVAAQRAADLCRQMLIYAGKSLSAPGRVNIMALVSEMATMLRASLPQNVAINLVPSAEIPSIKADASQIRQIVMNLIINASEALDTQQGEIRLALKKMAIGEEHPDKDYFGNIIPPGWYVCLEVSDDGCGMAEETKSRIFEPFYTTKFTGRGLGMSAVLGIIKAHVGALQLISQPGQGTTFKVYLPFQSNEPTVDESRKPASTVLWQGSGTILLVEDEPQLAMIATMLLNELGFSVIEAANGKQALEMYRDNKEQITLVMTDIGMPVMDGYDLFRELKKLDSQLPIIVSSGFSDKDITAVIPREDMAAIISKPYSRELLQVGLQSVLNKMPPKQP